MLLWTNPRLGEGRGLLASSRKSSFRILEEQHARSRGLALTLASQQISDFSYCANVNKLYPCWPTMYYSFSCYIGLSSTWKASTFIVLSNKRSTRLAEVLISSQGFLAWKESMILGFWNKSVDGQSQATTLRFLVGFVRSAISEFVFCPSIRCFVLVTVSLRSTTGPCISWLVPLVAACSAVNPISWEVDANLFSIHQSPEGVDPSPTPLRSVLSETRGRSNP